MEMDPDTSVVSKVTADEKSKLVDNANPRILNEIDKENNSLRKQEVPLVSASASAANLCLGSNLNQEQESETKTADSAEVNLSSVEDDDGKPAGSLKNHTGKRKVKVDWMPELHRKFVKAVEQLGVDKAVPSKILELMGVDCLNRLNVASHLQKYRRKHLLAREAETSRWNRRLQIFGTTKKVLKRNENSCALPMMTGFPPVDLVHHVRPLHVWGHPYAGQSVEYTWSNQITPPPVWLSAHHQPPGNTSSWYFPCQDVPALGMPCFPHYPSMRFDTPVTGVLPVYLYRGELALGVPIVPSGQILLSYPPFDSTLSEEIIDAVIGDVLSKPWLPLPLGLKPPSIDGVMVELQRQEKTKIPSQCTLTT